MFSRTIGEIADKRPLYVPSDATLSEVAQAMAARGRGCAFVRENEAVAGMITEHSFLRCLLDVPAEEARASRAMLIPPPSVGANGLVPQACRALTQKRVKHLAVHDTAGLVVGVVSDTDLAAAVSLDFMMENTTCQTIMTKTVLAGAAETNARAVAQAMLERGMGCMLTVADGRPTGIVTEWDLMCKASAREEGLNLPIAEFLSSPVICVPQTGMVYKVILHLRQNGIHQVPVVDEAGHIQGVLSFADIMRRAAAFV